MCYRLWGYCSGVILLLNAISWVGAVHWMWKWWIFCPDISLLLYLYISTSFIGILSFGLSGLSKAFRGVFALRAPRVVSFFNFNTWTLINILDQNWWETGPSFYSGRTHLAIFCFRILPIPTIYIYIYIYAE